MILAGRAVLVLAMAVPPQVYDFAPKMREPPELEPLLRHLAPGNDAFPEEKVAQELAERLGELGTAARADPGRAREVVERLLAPDAKGGGPTPAEAPVATGAALEIRRAGPAADGTTRDRSALAQELGSLFGSFAAIETAEFLLTGVALGAEGAAAETEVRYDLVGRANPAGARSRSGAGGWPGGGARTASGASRPGPVSATCAAAPRAPPSPTRALWPWARTPPSRASSAGGSTSG